jgi:hypothetical protein
MDSSPQSYTQRCARIAEILEPYVQVSRLSNTTARPDPFEDDELSCSWGDPETGIRWVSVYVKPVSDVPAAVARHRDHVGEYQLRGEDSYSPVSAREEVSDREGEFIFIFEYLDRVTAIVGDCQISILTDGRIASVSDLVEPALEIGRRVGCSAYENDFVPPEIPDKWRGITWGSPGIAPMPLPPPQ